MKLFTRSGMQNRLFPKLVLLLAICFGLVSCVSTTPANTQLANSQVGKDKLVNSHPWVAACKDWDDWDKAGPPFQIFGNSYYVGTCGISAVLITSAQGHVLIDGGTVAGAQVIADNIRTLGFSINDIKLLLHSHEHFDHAAGFAKLQSLSGAKLLASAAAAPVLSTGITSELDPQAGMHEPFPAARVDGIVESGREIAVGDIRLIPTATPGHSYGALSWQWESCQNEQCKNLVYADSLSPVSRDDYLFSDHPDYVQSYQRGLVDLAALDCDLLLAPHPSASKMRERLASPQGLIDSSGCRDYAEAVSNRLAKRLAKEAEKAERPTTAK